MGRYYNGDIEGKFWFGVQSSTAADQFGSLGTQGYMDYYFDEDNLPDIEKRIEEIISELGDYKTAIDDFFKEKDSYNNEQLEEYLDVGEDKVQALLVLYADLELGEKIRDCVKEKGCCDFRAEL